MNVSSRLPWSRREFLKGAGIVLAGAALPPAFARAESESIVLPAATLELLGKSGFIYVSPLKSDGNESSCHGEAWFFRDGDDAVLATASDTWKAKALGKGLDRARVWVGDHGRVRLGNEKFRKAPSFEARASLDKDPAAFERLLAAFAGKYPDEWDKWEPRFRKGYADGSRIVIRYSATGA